MKYKWWRYALAVLAFIMAYFLAPIVAALLCKPFNFLSPRAYQRSDMSITLIAYVLTPGVMLYAVGAIVDGSHKFAMVLMIIGAFYTVFVATWNYVNGIIATWTAISMGIEAVMFVILAVTEGKKQAEEELKRKVL